MNIKIQIQEIDYNAIGEALYPSLKKNICSLKGDSKKLLSGLLNILGELPLKTLSIIPQNTKNEITVFLINHVKEQLMAQLQKNLSDSGILLTSKSPEIINSGNDIILTIDNIQITKGKMQKQHASDLEN